MRRLSQGSGRWRLAELVFALVESEAVSFLAVCSLLLLERDESVIRSAQKFWGAWLASLVVP